MRVLNAAPSLLYGAGFVGGVVCGVIRGLGGNVGDAMFPSTGWSMSLFGAFGTMSGFALAALALIVSLSGHERAKTVLDANPGRIFTATLLRSVLLWFAPASLALLAAIVGEERWLSALVLGTATLALAGALVMLLGLWLFMSRFTNLNRT